MPAANAMTEPEFDFGDPELNDPDYEQNVGNIEDETEDTSTDTGAQEQTSDDTVTQQQPADADGDDAGEGGAGSEDGQQPPAPVGGTRSDDKGNLIDAQGNIIAAAGAERRHFERAQHLTRHVKNLERELAEAREASSMTGVLNDVPTKLGLDMRETEMGLQIVASFKKDPVATARWALQETMKMGYNLAQIVGADANGQPLSGSMDLAAVKAMIAETVAPLIGDRQAAARQSQVEADAEREYSAFVAKHPNSDIHDEVLAGMLTENEGLTPETAYWQLVAYCARNNLDFNQPLRAQVLARQQGQQPNNAGAAPNGNAQPRPAQYSAAPMPNGSTMTARTQQESGMANPNDSWDSIVQQSLRDAGFN